LNAKFITKYNEAVIFFESGTYEDEKWKNDLASCLVELGKLWPETDFEDLVQELNDYMWRIKQIYYWASLDINSIYTELENHGSLFFMDAKNYLNEDEIDEVLTKFWDLSADSEQPKSSAIYRLAMGKLKKLEKIERRKTKKSKLEILIQSLNSFQKHLWAELYNLSKSWDTDDRFLKILNELKKPNSKIKKADFHYFVDYLIYLIEKGYIVKITTNNSIEVTKKVLFNDLIKELNEYTKNS